MTEKRIGEWVATYLGIHFYPADPRENEVKITDIAYALSNICRFNGHTKYFYSVAQHSIFVSKELERLGFEPSVCLVGLLHDASEAYICDIPTPVKDMLPEYKKMEEQLQNTIYKALMNRVPTNEELAYTKMADVDALYTEALEITTDHSWIHWTPKVGTKVVKITDHEVVCEVFMHRYFNLMSKAVKPSVQE